MEAEMEQQEKLDQRLEESAVQIIKLVDSLPKTLLGRRITD